MAKYTNGNAHYKQLAMARSNKTHDGDDENNGHDSCGFLPVTTLPLKLPRATTDMIRGATNHEETTRHSATDDLSNACDANDESHDTDDEATVDDNEFASVDEDNDDDDEDDHVDASKYYGGM